MKSQAPSRWAAGAAALLSAWMGWACSGRPEHASSNPPPLESVEAVQARQVSEAERVAAGVFAAGTGRDFMAVEVSADGSARMLSGREPRLIARGRYTYSSRSRLLSFFWDRMECATCRGATTLPASMFRNLPDLTNLYVISWTEESIKGAWAPLGWAAHPEPPPGLSDGDGGVREKGGNPQSVGQGDACHGSGWSGGRFCLARVPAFALPDSFRTTELQVKAVYPSSTYNGRYGVAMLVPLPGEPGAPRLDVQQIDRRNAVFTFLLPDDDLRPGSPVHALVRLMVVDALDDLTIGSATSLDLDGEASQTQFPVDLSRSTTPTVAVVDYAP